MAKEAQPNWDLDKISQDMGSPRELVHDPVLGIGASFELADITLELFPRANHLNLKTRSMLLGLNNIELIGSSPNDLIIQAEGPDGDKVICWLTPTGLNLHHSPSPTLYEAVQAPARPPRVAPSPTHLKEGSEPIGAEEAKQNKGLREQSQQYWQEAEEGSQRPEIAPNSGRSEQDDEDIIEEEIPANTQVKLEKQPRGTYLGRAGRKINYKTVKDYRNQAQEMLVCEFMLHLDSMDSKGHWIKVSAFREDAKRCQEQLKGGGAVSIVGYKHIKKWTDRKGVEHTKEELYSGHISFL
jgi:hypothetical protein